MCWKLCSQKRLINPGYSVRRILSLIRPRRGYLQLQASIRSTVCAAREGNSSASERKRILAPFNTSSRLSLRFSITYSNSAQSTTVSCFAGHNYLSRPFMKHISGTKGRRVGRVCFFIGPIEVVVVNVDSLSCFWKAKGALLYETGVFEQARETTRNNNYELAHLLL